MKAPPLVLLARLLGRQRRLIAAALAAVAVFAALAALGLTGTATTTVARTTRALTGGSRITEADVELVALPSADLPEAYLDDPAAIVGRTLTVTLPRHAVLLPSSVVAKPALATPGWVVVPVTLSVAATGLVAVGDRIDLIGATDADQAPQVQAAGVRVVAVVTDSGTDGPFAGGTGAGPVVLVEVLPASAPRLAALAALGPVAFALS